MFLEDAREAYDFVCFDRRPTKGVPDAIVADLTDAEAVRKAIKGCDAVLHLGAFAINNWDFLGIIVPPNIIGMYNVLDAAAKEGVKKVVLASTVQTEFGHPEGTKVSVKMPPWPTNFYAATKVFAENTGLVFSRQHGISVICLRFGGVMVPSRHMGASDIGLTRNDAVMIIRRALDIEGVKFAVVPAYSKNAAAIKDLAPLKEVLGIEPAEDAYEITGRTRRGEGGREGGASDRVEAMLEAADRGDLMAMDSLIKGDPRLADTAGQDPHWESESMKPLHCAARAGKLEAVKFLLDRNVELNPKDGHLNRTPLLFAAERRQREVADLLVARGAEVDLHTAAALGDEAKVTAFLDHDPAAVNAKGPEGGTPLHFAGTPGVAKLLLDRGADINARDEHRHNSVLGWCLRRPGVARVIVDRLGNLDIFIACALGDTDRVREFLAKDQALANARTPRDHPVGGGRAPISIAAMRGHIEVVRALLDAGADANSLDRRGATPLHHAAGEGMADMVQLLLDRGANPNYREENWNSTPLDWATYGENPAVVAILQKVTRAK